MSEWVCLMSDTYERANVSENQVMGGAKDSGRVSNLIYTWMIRAWSELCFYSGPVRLDLPPGGAEVVLKWWFCQPTGHPVIGAPINTHFTSQNKEVGVMVKHPSLAVPYPFVHVPFFYAISAVKASVTKSLELDHSLVEYQCLLSGESILLYDISNLY